MGKIKAFIFAVLTILIISISFINVDALDIKLKENEANDSFYFIAFNYNKEDYKVYYLNEDTEISFDSNTGILHFESFDIIVEKDNVSYPITSYLEVTNFDMKDFAYVISFHEKIGILKEFVCGENIKEIDELVESFCDEIDYLPYNISMSFEENIESLNQYYGDAFIFRLIGLLSNEFDELNEDRINTFDIIMDNYFSLTEDSNIDMFVSEYGYENFDDLNTEMHLKIDFDKVKEEYKKEILSLVHKHEGQEIREKAKEISDNLDLIIYERSYTSIRDNYENMLNSLDREYFSLKDSFRYYQEYYKLFNYLNYLLDEVLEKDIYSEDNKVRIIEYIYDTAFSKLRRCETINEVLSVRNEIDDYIYSFDKLIIESSEGSISSEDGMSSSTNLVITKEDGNTDNEEIYEIKLIGNENEENGTYRVSIYDVDIKREDYEVYQILENGEKVLVESGYENNVLTVNAVTLGKIVVVGVKEEETATGYEAPWLEMTIVFGVLFISLIIVSSLFRGKRNER